VFALSHLKDTADEALIAVVRGDFSRAVKKQALFRLGRSAVDESPLGGHGAGAHLEARRKPRLSQVRSRFAAGSNVDVFGIVTRRLWRFRCRASAAQQDMNRDD